MKVAVAALAASVVLASCSASSTKGGAERTVVRPNPSVRELSPTTTAPVLDPPIPYTPLPNEVEPAVKTAAASSLQALLTYTRGGGTVEAARRRLEGLAALPDIAAKAAPLLAPADESAADIVYPQLGGLTPDAASVMVVTRVRQNDPAGRRSAVVRTIDVRLEQRAGVWTVIDLASTGGDPVPRPAQVSPAAVRVLDHPSIELPDTARWDIYAGRIADRVLETLANIADDRPVAVSVLSTGHPIEVFGSAHISNHTAGRAVDLWSVGGAVVDQRAPDGTLRPVVDRLLRDGVTELGAPFDVDGARGANFTNIVHQDHLHIGFDQL